MKTKTIYSHEIVGTSEEEFKKFVDSVEKKKKVELLKRVADAQTKDKIGDGAVSG